MDIKIKNGYFEIDGREKFIASGEVQYFRLEKESWETIITRLKEANCNTLSTYVPWNWHEYEKGQFDFSGKTHPSRDLKSFLDIVKKNGLNLIIKIGPHIHAEFLNGGTPLWMLEEHPEILCLGSDGEPTKDYAFYPPVTYLHPVYMDYVGEWYRRVLEILLAYDNIIIWQVDNETSYNISFFGHGKSQAFNGDYNPFIVKNGLYQKFLTEKFRKIDFLNKRYNESNKVFSEVKPPVKEPENDKEYFKALDWVDFRETLVALYLRELIEIMYSSGCRGPFAVNDPLLGYATSWRNIYNIVKDPRWNVIIGYTYYAGNIEEETVGAHLAKVRYTSASGTSLVGNMEIQAGDAYFLSHWKENLSDYNLLWKIAVGAGANMINYYWFADGYNFNGYEYFLPELNFNSPVDKTGKKREQFELIKNIGEFLNKYSEIVEAEPVYDLTIGFYHPWAQAAKFNNGQGIEGFELEPSHQLTGSFIDLMGVCNINFQLLNLDDNLASSVKSKKLIVPCYKFLGKDIQQRLLDFAQAGGNLILGQSVPTRDEELNHCPILWDALGLKCSKTVLKPPGFFGTNKIRYKNYYFPVNSDVEVFDFNNEDKLKADLRLLKTNEICGFTKSIGKGKISVIGFVPRVFMDISRKFARDYFNKKSEDKIFIFERKNGNFSLFTICNFYERERKVKIKEKEFRVPPRDAIFVTIKNKNEWNDFVQ